MTLITETGGNHYVAYCVTPVCVRACTFLQVSLACPFKKSTAFSCVSAVNRAARRQMAEEVIFPMRYNLF
jgi:hypothetical protein